MKHAKKRGTNEHVLINVREDDDVRHWATELDVSEKALTGAVKAVGPSLDKVREYLSRNASEG